LIKVVDSFDSETAQSGLQSKFIGAIGSLGSSRDEFDAGGCCTEIVRSTEEASDEEGLRLELFIADSELSPEEDSRYLQKGTGCAFAERG
jgi:hypothetical protein